MDDVTSELPPEPSSAPDYVLKILRSAIRKGEIRPGERLSPEQLAGRLGVSHIPVREALRELSAEGQVIVIPRRGFFASDLSLVDAEDIYRWRRVLEDEAQRLGFPRLTEEDFDVMKRLSKRMDGLASKKDAVGYAEANRAFHFTVFGKASSQHVDRFLRHLWGAAERYYFAHLEKGTEFAKLQAQHRELLEALMTRDIQRANAIMEEHRTVTLEAIREKLSERNDDALHAPT